MLAAPARRGFATVVSRHAIGSSVAAIDTPALVVDLDAMERNLRRMQSYADAHRVALRPHAKMHKCAAIAKLQMAAGAVGVCVQKTSEAEALAADGITDIYISNEVTNGAKLRRVAHLARYLQQCRGGSIGLAICCDSVLGVQRLATALQGEALSAPCIRVLVEIDVGQQRCGAPSVEDAVAIAEEIAKHASLMTFGGIQAYHGGAQHIRSFEERREVAKQFTAYAARVKAAIEERGIAVPLVTGAGTGTFPFEATSSLYGELQAGSYLFMDRDYGDNGPVGEVSEDPVPTFEHALFVLTEVISVSPQGDSGICDAGHKSHAVDSGLPRVHNRPDVEFINKGDEHGKLVGGTFVVGDRFALIPGHCDPTVNLHDAIIGIRGGITAGHVEAVFEVTARGCLS